MQNIIKFIVCALFCFAPLSLLAQDNSIELKGPEGREFWLCFMKNHNDPVSSDAKTQLHLELFITGNEDANVRVEIKSIGYTEDFFVQAGTVKNVIIDPLAQVKSVEVVEQKHAVHISSDKAIAVYGLNRRKQTTDTFMGLPIDVLGNTYRAMCYNMNNDLLPQMAVVATENDTKITITPAVETVSGKAANVPFSITLNKGDVYQIASKNSVFRKKNNDLTGSLIVADKKIAVFSGHQCAYVPDNVIACNHLVEQLPPLPSWGKHYYIGMLKKRSSFVYRVLADQDSTKVFEDSKLIGILKAGEFIEKIAKRALQVTADKPVLVSQYSQGFNNGDSIGDPMMLLISPTQQFLKKYRIATPVNGFWEHFVNIVCPTTAIQSMKMNGKKIAADRFEQLGKSRYSIAYMRIDFGTYEIEGDEPFGLTSYGFGFNRDQFDAYGNIAGQSFVEFVETPDILAPLAEYITNLAKPELILRDDRRDDLGLKSVKILSQSGLEFTIPNIEAGMPQASIFIKVSDPSQISTATLEATDMAGNSAVYSFCYHFDASANAMVLKFANGIISDCKADKPIYASLSYKLAQNMHTMSFSESGNLKAKGLFSDNNVSSSNFAIQLTKPMNHRLSFSGRIGFEAITARSFAPDTFKSTYLNLATAKYEDLQEGTSLEFDAKYVSLSFLAHYLINENIYLSAGFETGLNISSANKVYREVIYPVNYVYENRSTRIIAPNSEDHLSSTVAIRFAAEMAFGMIVPVYENYSAFAEINYNYGLNSIVSDQDWKVNRLGTSLGIRMTF